jgi:hypothetical protein
MHSYLILIFLFSTDRGMSSRAIPNTAIAHLLWVYIKLLLVPGSWPNRVILNTGIGSKKKYCGYSRTLGLYENRLLRKARNNIICESIQASRFTEFALCSILNARNVALGRSSMMAPAMKLEFTMLLVYTILNTLVFQLPPLLIRC